MDKKRRFTFNLKDFLNQSYQYIVWVVLGQMKSKYLGRDEGYDCRFKPKCPFCGKEFKEFRIRIGNENSPSENRYKRWKIYSRIIRSLTNHIRKAHPEFWKNFELSTVGRWVELHDFHYGLGVPLTTGLKVKEANSYICKKCGEEVIGVVGCLVHWIEEHLLEKVVIQENGNKISIVIPKEIVEYNLIEKFADFLKQELLFLKNRGENENDG